MLIPSTSVSPLISRTIAVRTPTPRSIGIRSFSLWPSSSSSPSSSSTPPSPSDELPLDPIKPSLSDFLPPASVPASTYLEPLSTLFLSLPPSLSLSYATFIPLFTLLYRSSTTLPVVLWQRRRTRRFTEKVIPLLKKEQGQLALTTRDECRRLGKSFEEYQKVFQTRAKQAAYTLARRFHCSPRLTLILPPLIHLPLFLTATLTLRDACTRSLSSLPLTSTSLSSLSTPTQSLSPSALSHLHELASTPFLWCPSLVLPDPTMFLPLGVGIAALLNVELSAKNRLAQTEAATNSMDHAPSRPPVVGVKLGGPVSASEKRRLLARRARAGEDVKVRGYSSLSRSEKKEQEGVEFKVGGTKPNTARIVTNILRFASVAFIPVAGLAPSAVCLYWIASNLFTLVQNGLFNRIDRKREEEKRLNAILNSS